MSSIVVDAALKAQLAEVEGPTEICDAEGRVIAYAVSPGWHHRLVEYLSPADMLDSKTSGIEEFERDGGLTIDDMRKYLQSIDNGAEP